MAEYYGRRGLTDLCLYKLLDQIWMFPESGKGRAFCRGYPSGPINEFEVIKKAEKEKLEWRRKNYTND